MRRFPVLLSLLVVTLLGLVGLSAQWSATAQEATPAGGMGMEEGVLFEPLAFAFGVDLPSTADLVLVRISLDPGATLPLLADDPGSGVLLVESGTFTVQAETELSVTRGADLADAMAAAEEGDVFAPPSETVASGEEVTLEEGDAAYIPGNITGEIRNDGDEPADALGFLVAPGARS